MIDYKYIDRNFFQKQSYKRFCVDENVILFPNDIKIDIGVYLNEVLHFSRITTNRMMAKREFIVRVFYLAIVHCKLKFDVIK